MTISPDGRSVYVASVGSDALAVFSRDPITGALTQLAGEAGCVSDEGKEGCARGRGLLSPTAVTVSPDGHSVYVASLGSDAVAVFSRDPTTGALTQLAGEAGCLSNGGEDGCARGRGLFSAIAVALSPDGRSAYVAALHAVAVLSRDPTTGALTQLRRKAGCVSDAPGEGCARGRGLDGPISVTVGPDGRSIYVASRGLLEAESDDAIDLLEGRDREGDVAVFARHPPTGRLRQLRGRAGCVSQETTERSCARGRGLSDPTSVALSPDGRSAYVTGDGVEVFARNRRTGALAQLPGQAGCVSQPGRQGCARGRGVRDALSVAISRDGRNVYVASVGSDAVAVFKRQLRRLSLRFTG